jgi:class I fructose-bisphosphate aldolase
MNLGKQIRLQRIFSHPSGRLCSVAVDHFIGYQKGLPTGLINVPRTLQELVAGRPDAVTMLKGMAMTAWEPYAGKVPLVISSVCFTPDDSVMELVATAEEVAQLGADAIAVAIGVRGPNEGRYLKMLCTAVEQASRLNIPVFAHIYPRSFSSSSNVTIVHDPENIMWAVRCGIECGADVIKVPFTGDAESYRQIVATCPVPLIAAGGPKCNSLEEALELLAQAISAGARGATIGRNIWGERNPTGALKAFKALIHDGRTPEAALQSAKVSSGEILVGAQASLR